MTRQFQPYDRHGIKYEMVDPAFRIHANDLNATNFGSPVELQRAHGFEKGGARPINVPSPIETPSHRTMLGKECSLIAKNSASAIRKCVRIFSGREMEFPNLFPSEPFISLLQIDFCDLSIHLTELDNSSAFNF